MVKEKAQVILETCFIFVAMALFLFGILGIWLWFNVDVADRSTAFNETRLRAGRNPDRYVLGGPIILEDYFSSRPITEDWVFAKGEFNAPEEVEAPGTLSEEQNSREWRGQPLSELLSEKDRKKLEKYEKRKKKITEKRKDLMDQYSSPTEEDFIPIEEDGELTERQSQ